MKAAPTRIRQAQHLLFAVGDQRCSLELARMDAIVPWVTLRAENIGDGWMGWMDYRGQAVPVADAEQLLFGSSTEPHLGARILLLHCAGRLTGVVVSDAVSIGYEDEISRAEVERFDPCEILSSMLSGLPASEQPA